MNKRKIVAVLLVAGLLSVSLWTDAVVPLAAFLIACGVLATGPILLWQGIRRLRHKNTLWSPLIIAILSVAGGMMSMATRHVLAPPPVPDAALGVSRQLSMMIRMDQNDRYTLRFLNTQRDRQRTQRVLEFHQRGQIIAPQDQYHAAFLFQHGGSAENYELAHQYATSARDAGVRGADWLFEATYDRWMESIGRPQKYGTQHTLVIGGGSAE